MSDAPILNPMTVVDDYAGADDFAKKHTPLIEVTDTGEKKLVAVTVGKDVPHPNLPDHYIAWILLRANGNPIARFDLTPVAADPKTSVVIAVDPGTEITAIEYCNLHGLFSYSVKV
jgi:superoxide reductase